MNTIPFVITAIVSYLLGSIPFGYLLVRLVTGEDVRTSGSGNIGATNVARKSPILGVATLLLDAAKGLAAVYFARLAFSGPHRHLIMTTAALFAVVGHLFPIWLKFRGGKGVATSFGAFVLITPKSILCMVVIFILLAVAFRYVSLGSIAVAAAFPLLAWALGEYHEPIELLIIAIVSVLVICKHRQNINRLTSGTESRIGSKLAQSKLGQAKLGQTKLGQTSTGHSGERG
ncbi:MAG: glycerol-3-phosphate 1-O-acyltransferase PlsY [Terriglobales bacterium]